MSMLSNLDYVLLLYITESDNFLILAICKFG
uniref:Uncharacterized protein n=1 Tax=Lepeophtheirus salmonis TaxID=72036 RepID=A0A0K2V273_LEPSM